MLRHTAWYSLALVIPVAVHLASNAQSSLEDLHFAISRSSVTSVLELYLIISSQSSNKHSGSKCSMAGSLKSTQAVWRACENTTDTPISLPSFHFFTFSEGAAGPIQTNRTSWPSLATLWRPKINYSINSTLNLMDSVLHSLPPPPAAAAAAVRDRSPFRGWTPFLCTKTPRLPPHDLAVMISQQLHM